jgi:hypothetical protein
MTETCIDTDVADMIADLEQAIELVELLDDDDDDAIDDVSRAIEFLMNELTRHRA